MSQPTDSGTTHVLVVSMAAFGHARPEVTLALRLLTIHSNLRITLIAPEPFKDAIERIIASFRLTSEQHGRFRLLWTPSLAVEDVKAHSAEQDDGQFIQHCIWQARTVRPSLIKVLTSDFIDADGRVAFADPPEVIIMETLVHAGLLVEGPDIWEELHVSQTERPKIYNITPTGFCFIAAYASTEDAIMGDIVATYALDVESGMQPDQAYEKHVINNPIRLSERWGCGPMFAFEAEPNDSSPLRTHMKSWIPLIKICHEHPYLVVWPSLSAFRPGLSAASAWNVATIAPQLSPYEQALGASQRLSAGVQNTAAMDPTREAISWLDDVVREDGSHSVLYMCFGSEFWPPTPEQTGYLFEALSCAIHQKSGRPVRLLLVSPRFGERNYADEIQTAVDRGFAKLGRNAKRLKWVDQWRILQHPAIGFFLSHGGSNSAQEAILTGTPMIVWPGNFDQPFIANQLSTLGCAYELLQCRTGHNIGRMTARGVMVKGTPVAQAEELNVVLAKAFGEDGQSVRDEMGKLRDRVKYDMEEGESWKVMQSFAQLGRHTKLFWEK